VFCRLRWSLSGNGSGPPWNRTGYFTYENKYRTAFDIDTRKRTGYYRIYIRLPARLAVGDLLECVHRAKYHYGDSMKYYTADEHYGHANILKFCNRPYDNVEQMQEDLITRHNSIVRKDDFTWHVGDVFWRTLDVKEARKILSTLNGKHGLIIGNHDEVALRIAGMFNAVYDQFYDQSTKPGVFLNHYAMRAWAKSHAGSYHVFGHTHNVLPDYRRSHDVGVDANNYFPISFDQLDSLMKSKGTLPPDEVELDMTRQKWSV